MRRNVSRHRAHAMKTNPKVVILAVSCFLAGFSACYWLTRQPQPTPAATTPAPTPFAMLTRSVVSTQAFRIDDGVWYHHPDGVMRRTPPKIPELSAPHLRPGYYDLIDTRSEPPPLDLK